MNVNPRVKNLYLVVFLISFLFVSCEKLEVDKRGTLSMETYFTDKSSLEDGVIGIYGLLHRATWSLDILAAYSGADDIAGRTGCCKSVMLDGDFFYRFTSNSWINYIWDTYYQTILACNSMLAYANSEQIDEINLKSARANAHFIRGMLYFRLTTIFGDIPMPLLPEADLEICKTSMREVMEQCIFDLEYASNWALNERDMKPSIADGHATKTAAKSLLAKTYMQLTGWPFYESDKWEEVKNLTKSIIDEGVYSLMDDYALCFQDPHQFNKEMIWSHVCQLGEYPVKAENRYFGWKWSSWMDARMEWTYYENFPEGYRKQFCTVCEELSSEYFYNIYPMVTKFLYGTIKGTPKYEHGWQTSNDIPVMRYSEVLLMYAEACANLGEHEEAIEKLNWVKRRAFAKGVKTQNDIADLEYEFWKIEDVNVDYTLEKLPIVDAIVDAIVFERAYEFLGEPGGNRWLDLVRLERVAEANSTRDERDDELLGNPSNKELWFFLIPDYELEFNPNLNTHNSF